jgi:hypothetical protein
MLRKKGNEMTKLKYEIVWNEVDVNNSVKLSWFEVPAKVKQVNDNLFSFTTESNNIKEQWVTSRLMVAKLQWNEATKPGQFRRRLSKVV